MAGDDTAAAIESLRQSAGQSAGGSRIEAELARIRLRLDRIEQRPIAKRAPIAFKVEKFATSGKRRLSGLASTPNLDRHGDIVEPYGATWTLPLPLLFAHDHKQIIGTVKSITPSAQGLHIAAELVEGVGKADECWSLIQAGALDSFSVGFIGIKREPIPSGYRWTKWELIEISVVSVPSNRDAKISARSAQGTIKLHPGAVRLVGSSAPHHHQGAIKLRTP